MRTDSDIWTNWKVRDVAGWQKQNNKEMDFRTCNPEIIMAEVLRTKAIRGNLKTEETSEKSESEEKDGETSSDADTSSSEKSEKKGWKVVRIGYSTKSFMI